MADSTITKKALAAALKELLEEMPFEKISVVHICEKCGMNRKSFYYHFKDKYDLVNWIFDTDVDFVEFAAGSTSVNPQDARWDFVEKVCEYFYKNRSFYRKVLLMKGQNSFPEHFREYIFPFVENRVKELIGNCEADAFTINFFSDAVLCAMVRWLSEKDCMTPEQFVSKIKCRVLNGAATICGEIAQERK